MMLPDDAFGDPFLLDQLPLPRPAAGYAVQKLGEDQVLDAATGEFKTLRTPGIRALFPSHADAHKAAADWLSRHGMGPDQADLAIVPAGFDADMGRPILILGVLEPHPDGKTAYLTGTPLALLNTPAITGKDGV